MHVLCVAEKPSIAKSITQILSGGQFNIRTTSNKFIKNYDFTYRTHDTYTVTSVAGHLLAFDFNSAFRGWNSCDPLTLFDAAVEVKVPEDKKSIEKNLVSEARRTQMLMIWTDCDREGENIGMEIVQICRKSNPNINVKRAKFSAIIPQQIHNAAQHPVELDKAQADAVDARTILDLRLGAAFTRMQSLSLQARFGQLSQQPISYGPCQFPTLGFVVSRYEQVQAFSPETFWYIYLSLRTTVPSSSKEDPEDVEFTWKRGRLFDFEVSLAIYEGVVTNPTARVTSVTQKPTKKWKPLPLTTVELQKSGSRLLKMTPKKILDISEKLYQQGFLSYPRTETDQFDPSFDFMSLIQKQTTDTEWGAFATSLQDGGFTRPRQGKKNDNAHPPIHPTAHVANLAGDEKKVYEYITRRFLACCSKDAEGWETTVNVTCGREEFYSTGLQIIERNYLDVFPYDKWVGKHIPEFKEGEEFIPTVCELKEGQTTRPSYLTEADLVGLMDKNGIGTDATIAQHIQTIIDREYVVEKKEGSIKYLIPSKLGIGLVEGYNKIGFEKSLSKPQLRRETERRMVQICDGNTSKQEMLNQSIEQYREVFLRARNEFNQVISSVRRHLEGRPPDENMPPDQGPHNDDDDNNPGNPPNAQPPTNKPPDGNRRGGGGGNGGGGRKPAPPPPEPNSRDDFGIASGSLSRPSQVDSSGNSDPTEVLCKCSVPVVERTVTKESANKGRKFRACGNQGGCDFFEWMDIPSSSSVASVTVPTKRMRSQTTSGGGGESSSNDLPVKRCKCDMTAVEKTVVKEGINKGRKFWTCPNSEKARCQFFEWGDEGTKSAPAQVLSQDRLKTNDECFKCGQSGHWSNACPNTGTSSNKTGNRAFGSNTQSNTSGECFKASQSFVLFSTP
ncbi:hypothetical protein Clacol_006398 [Clathrus columnatus]|uniref:DNA topoisomerase n=1 Tax=Clathrus columnatus TaxID=1419009 RepID=A0AAV5AEK4_9AGAM|nr:hypothetical protein Clacol_006398 [Clathrus columnatus]